MKKLVAVIVILSMVLCFACSKHNLIVTSPNTGSMNVVANSKAINSTNCVATSGGQVSIITASFGSYTDITFNLKTRNLIATTYNLDSSGADNNVEYSPGGVPVLSKSGSVVITTINPGVNYIGSFNFICVDGTVVSGTFTATAIK